MNFELYVPCQTDLWDAREFCRKAHDSINHKRKYTGEPYWHHTEKVAALVFKYCYGRVSPQMLNKMIKAAFAHDLIEDVTPCNPTYCEDYILAFFGEDTFALIKDLTDVYVKEAFPNMNRKDRKNLEAERLVLIRTESQIIKLCDLEDNTNDITQQDKGFAKLYLKEKAHILKLMMERDDNLDSSDYDLWTDEDFELDSILWKLLNALNKSIKNFK